MRLLYVAALFLATLASAQAPNDCIGGFDLSPKPSKCELHQLTNGEPADADKVMQNFNTLSDAIDDLGVKVEMVAPIPSQRVGPNSSLTARLTKTSFGINGLPYKLRKER